MYKDTLKSHQIMLESYFLHTLDISDLYCLGGKSYSLMEFFSSDIKRWCLSNHNENRSG